MLTDRAGIGPGGRRPITARRVIAAAGTVLAVGLAVSGRLSVGDLVVWALVLALVAGAMTGVQPALNGQVGAKTGEPLVATVVNFVGGTAGLALALAIEHLAGHAWTAPPAPWSQPVLWLGGTIGVAFILAAVIVVRPLGVLLLSARMCGYEGPACYRLGAVVEMVHSATLVHDDIIDDAKVRRGSPNAQP